MLEFSVLSTESLSKSQHAEVLALCSAAYEEDFSAYLSMLGSAMHLMGSVDGKLVSHVAWVARGLRIERLGSLQAAYVEAVATLPDYQGIGYASALMKRIPSLVREFDLAALSPSDESYYRRLGWVKWEGPLSYTTSSGEDVPTPEEEVMIYRLPRTPSALDLKAKMTVDWRPLEVW